MRVGVTFTSPGKVHHKRDCKLVRIKQQPFKRARAAELARHTPTLFAIRPAMTRQSSINPLRKTHIECRSPITVFWVSAGSKQ
eukprot:7017641-Prymnesium_polylepis.1